MLQLAVSRPTLREAIGRLAAEGVLEARRGSGTYVTGIAVDDVFAVRLQLEPFAARLAAQRRTPAQAKELKALLRRIERSRHDALAFAGYDERIHDVLAGATSNALLHDMLKRLAALAKLSRVVTSIDASVRDRVLVHMTALIAAVDARDAAGAERAMKQHLSLLRRAL